LSSWFEMAKKRLGGIVPAVPWARVELPACELTPGMNVPGDLLEGYSRLSIRLSETMLAPFVCRTLKFSYSSRPPSLPKRSCAPTPQANWVPWSESEKNEFGKVKLPPLEVQRAIPTLPNTSRYGTGSGAKPTAYPANAR